MVSPYLGTPTYKEELASSLHIFTTPRTRETMSSATRGDLEHVELFTDFYELTMAQGYWRAGRADKRACFDYFFRSLPFEGGFVIFAGLGDLLDRLDNLQFDETSLAFLAEAGLDKDFLDYLSTWRFKGNIRAAHEGEVVFPLEPILQVEGSMLDAQLLEALLLNTLNFQSLIATKAARIKLATKGAPFVEFGLRRAQGMGALQASRAAMIGGASGTSNVHAAFQLGLSLRGTQAHAWIQHYDDELEAFRAWADLYPNNCVLLVDTYNTLGAGVPNAITVGKELAAKGKSLEAIRLDSGDLAYLSKKARAMLDEAGLTETKIYATNQLDEHLIESLKRQGAPIDLYGVGTRLVTGHDAGALDGVYKLAVRDGEPCLKISDNFTKVNFPGDKNLWRYFDANGNFYGDAISLASEAGPSIETIYHPFFPEQRSKVASLQREELLHDVVKEGERVLEDRSIAEIAAYSTSRLDLLPEEHRRFENPHTYKVGVTKELLTLRSDLYNATRGRALGEEG